MTPCNSVSRFTSARPTPSPPFERLRYAPTVDLHEQVEHRAKEWLAGPTPLETNTECRIAGVPRRKNLRLVHLLSFFIPGH